MIKKHKLILFVLVSVCLISSIFFLNTSEKQYFTSVELKEIEHNKKLERRNQGIYKQDAPDVIREELANARKYIGEEKDSRSVNYIMDSFKQAKRNKSNVSNLNWINRGPGNVGGRTRALVVDKNDTTMNTWIAASVGGGIWKSVDRGLNWENLTDHQIPNLAFSSLVQSSSNPEILYAGSGEGFGSIDAIRGAGVFKSVDGGLTWSQIESTASSTNFSFINRMLINPSNADVLVIATNTGVYKTSNGGSTWSNTLSPGNRVQDLRMNHNNFNTQYAAVNGVGIYRSGNGGSTWTKKSDDFGGARTEIALSRTTPSTIYAATQMPSNGSKLSRSFDSGTTWTEITGINVSWLGGQGWYDNTIMVHPFNPDIVYVGGVNLYRIDITVNAGTATLLNGAGNTYVHADQHSIEYYITDLENEKFFTIVTNDGGIFYNENGLLNIWSERTNSYTTSQFYGGDRHPYQKRYIGGMQDNGSWYNNIENPISTSPWSSSTGGDGYDGVWHKTDPKQMIATSQYNATYKTNDGGNSWYEIAPYDEDIGYFINQLDNYRTNPDALYHLNKTQLEYSFDFGENWLYYTFPNEFANNTGSFTDVRVSRANPAVVWLSARMINNSVSPLVSTDSGRTFIETNYYTANNYSFTGLATHPTDELTSYMLSSVPSPKVIRTTDLGISWENISTGIPDVDVFSLLVIPDTTKNIFPIWLGTEIGIFVSEDNGASWQYSDFGFPAVAVWEMKIVDTEVVVATHGRGMWSVELENLLRQDYGEDIPLAVEENIIQNPSYQEHAFYTVDFDTLTRFNKTILTQNNISKELTLENYHESNYSYYAPFEITGNSEITINSRYLAFQGYDTLKTSIQLTPISNKGSEQTIRKDYVSLHIVEGSQKSLSSFLQINIKVKTRTIHNYQATDYSFQFGFEGKNLTHAVSLDLTVDEETLKWAKLFYKNGNQWELQDYEAHPDNRISSEITKQGVYALFLTNELNHIDEALPSHYALNQNYPNPFNPMTTITYQLSKQSKVEITIFNLLGQKIKTLINNVMPAGEHSVNWDATNQRGVKLPSGLYFYQMRIQGNIITRKMNLIK